MGHDLQLFGRFEAKGDVYRDAGHYMQGGPFGSTEGVFASTAGHWLPLSGHDSVRCLLAQENLAICKAGMQPRTCKRQSGQEHLHMPNLLRAHAAAILRVRCTAAYQGVPKNDGLAFMCRLIWSSPCARCCESFVMSLPVPAAVQTPCQSPLRTLGRILLARNVTPVRRRRQTSGCSPVWQ